MSAHHGSGAAHRRRRATLLGCSASALALALAVGAVPAFAQDTQNNAPDTTAAQGTTSPPTASPGEQGAAGPGPATTNQGSGTSISNSTSTQTKNPEGAAVTASPAGAAAEGPTVSAVVVTGTRAALATSQAIKRNSDTVVDSITATDINAFPDKSVAEALQRVAGITITRFAATSDTTHFSAEPSGVIVRGLQQVRSEFNGRDIFNANSGRGISFGDISPELMAGVDAYKNLTADMVEGGIAGTINLRTRVPFDAPGQLIAFSADALYGNLAKRVTPDISGLYSNRWTTSIGEFGFLADVNYSDVKTETDGVMYGRIGSYVGFTGPQTATTPNYGRQTVWFPSAISDHDTLYDRERTGVSLAGQWSSPDHKWLLTAQYNDFDYINTWQEHAIEGFNAYGFYGNPAAYACTPTDAACGAASQEPYPAPGTPPFTFDNGGMLTSGVMTTAIGWWGTGVSDARQYASNSLGQNMVNPCYGNADNNWSSTACTPPQRGVDFGTYTRYARTKENTGDGSINLKWDPSDDLHFNFDYQHIHSTVTNFDDSVEMFSYANIGIKGNGNNAPMMSIFMPTNVNFGPGLFQSASNYYFRDAMDHLENSEGDENAFRADGEYDFNSTWLNAIKFGYRYADRSQTVRWSTYNWANIANNWTQTGPGGIPQSAYWNTTNTTPVGPFTGYAPNLTQMYSLPTGFYGGTYSNMLTFPFFNMKILANHNAFMNALGVQAIGVGSWNPLCTNQGARSNELPGQCYTLAEIDTLDETTQAGYIMLRFGGNDAKIGPFAISGNVGVRYAHTLDVSTGGTVTPLWSPTSQQFACTTINDNPNPGGGTPTPHTPYSVGCYIFGGQAFNAQTGQYQPTGLPGQPQEVAFNNGKTTPSTAHNPSGDWLPAANLRVQLTDTWQMRFSYSRAMSRPDIGFLKNYFGVSAALPTTSNPVICGSNTSAQQVACFTSTNGQISGINGVQPYYTATAYNPYLKPITADQFDLTFENYFAKVGQFSVDFFYKQFNNYIQFGQFYAPVTSGGVTRTVVAHGPVNTTGASLEGAELSFQRFFDFLPGVWSGLGMQANFTYVKNTGLQNANLSIVGTPTVTNGGVPDQFNPGSLEGLSKYAFNLIGMYEKGPLALRLAYSWRSKFLVTALDCCTYLPMWQEDQGFLDGSIRYRIGEHVEVDLEGTNLLNTETILEQQVTDKSQGRKLIPSSWFKNDRRLQLGIRLKY